MVGLQSQADPHHAGAQDHVLPVHGDRVRAVAVRHGLPALLLPDAGPDRGARAHAGWARSRSPVATLSSLADAGIPPQDYLQKLVRPLFLHFENVTAGWTAVPRRLADQ